MAEPCATKYYESLFCVSAPRRVVPYLGIVGRFHSVMTPVFEIFNLIGRIESLFYASARSDWPLFLQKKMVCRYHI